MKILVDIGHPAHVHLYRNMIKDLQAKGHEVMACVKNIPAAKRLMELYNIDYILLGKKRDSRWGKFLSQFYYDYKVFKIVKKLGVDLGIGTSITLSHVSKISAMKSMVYDDDDDAVQPLFVKFAHPFCDYLLSPIALLGKRRKSQTIFYPGYHELAYLHPNRFSPDPAVLEESGLKQGEPFFVLRFNAFKAHHDVGVKGLSTEIKRKLIKTLEKKGRVFITTEDELSNDFKRYRLKVSPEKMHSLLFYATLFIGDSQTMTSEAAVLGTPAIRSNSFVGRISYLEELEREYKLAFGFKPNEFPEMLSQIEKLLAVTELKKIWQEKRQKMLKDKIDVTAFMVWMVEKGHDSIYRIKQESTKTNFFDQFRGG